MSKSHQKRSGTGAAIMEVAHRPQDGPNEKSPTVRPTSTPLIVQSLRASMKTEEHSAIVRSNGSFLNVRLNNG